MILTHALVILLVHFASLISCVDSHPTPVPSGAALHARWWRGRKNGTPAENIVIGCLFGLVFVGILVLMYRFRHRILKPRDPDPVRPSAVPLGRVVWTRRRTDGSAPEIVPAASIVPGKDAGDGERPMAEVRLPAGGNALKP